MKTDTADRIWLHRRDLLRTGLNLAALSAAAPLANVLTLAQGGGAVAAPAPPVKGTQLVLLGTQGGPNVNLRRGQAANAVVVDGTALSRGLRLRDRPLSRRGWNRLRATRHRLHHPPSRRSHCRYRRPAVVSVDGQQDAADGHLRAVRHGGDGRRGDRLHEGQHGHPHRPTKGGRPGPEQLFHGHDVDAERGAGPGVQGRPPDGDGGREHALSGSGQGGDAIPVAGLPRCRPRRGRLSSAATRRTRRTSWRWRRAPTSSCARSSISHSTRPTWRRPSGEKAQGRENSVAQHVVETHVEQRRCRSHGHGGRRQDGCPDAPAAWQQPQHHRRISGQLLHRGRSEGVLRTGHRRA